MFGSITLEPPLVFLPRTGTGRRTRTPTAVKGNAHSRFHTTACRLRNYRTLSASGRFSTSDSPPRLPLNLYCKSAAPCGVATLPLCIFSIAADSRFVNVLINKNAAQCSAKTPNFRHAPVPTPRARGALASGCTAARSRKNRRAHPSAHSAAASYQRLLGAELCPPKIQSSRSSSMVRHLLFERHTAIVCRAG